MEPGQEVILLKPNAETRKAFDEALLQAKSAPRTIASAGKMSPDMLKDIAQENCHVALNALTEVAEAGQSESARINAANAILDRAHGKVSGTDVQINIQQNFTSAQDDEILARYMAKKGVVIDG